MKPFVVELDYTRGDLGHPHWYFYLTGWFLSLFGLQAMIGAWFFSEERGLLSFAGAILGAIGTGFVLLARFVREHHTRRIELTKLAAAHEERIRKLEQQVAALTATSTPTHTHAA